MQGWQTGKVRGVCAQYLQLVRVQAELSRSPDIRFLVVSEEFDFVGDIALISRNLWNMKM